jgi:hypothetical protein
VGDTLCRSGVTSRRWTFHTTARHPRRSACASLISRLVDGDIFRLDSGREVRLEECHIERSSLGWIEGSKDFIRAEVIKTLPKRIRKQFPGDYYGLLVKPIPEGGSMPRLRRASATPSFTSLMRSRNACVRMNCTAQKLAMVKRSSLLSAANL